VYDLADPLEGPSASVGVADVPLEDLDTPRLQIVRQPLLAAVDQRIEHAHPATAREQLVDGGNAEVPGSA
jgi:hypothetical protein